MNSDPIVISKDEIARRAYDNWQARGCPLGDGTTDWQAAEAELLADRVDRGASTQQRMQSWWQRVREKVKRPKA